MARYHADPRATFRGWNDVWLSAEFRAWNIEARLPAIQEPTLQFYGDRTAAVEDPAGNQFWIATHVEDVSPEQLAERAKSH